MIIDGFCSTGTWESLGNFSGWGSLGFLLSLAFGVILLASFFLLVIWGIRRTGFPAFAGPDAAGQPTTMLSLQAQDARGEITREQYERSKNEIG